MSFAGDLRASLARAQWRRGLRAAFVVGTVMTACHALRWPAGHAAMGAYIALLVDNGGPYRTRLRTMLTVVLGGAASYTIGALTPQTLPAMVLVTMLVCLAVTFSRALSQPLASSSVLILVLYFGGLGGVLHTLPAVRFEAALVVGGGAWGILLSLVLWPLDPFRPARMAVADCFAALTQFTAELAEIEAAVPAAGETQPALEEPAFAGLAWRRMQRRRIEEARRALSSTMARAPSRTVRARSLSVLVETADMLLARTVRLAELADRERDPLAEPVRARIAALAAWLAGAEAEIRQALLHRPANRAASFAHDGTRRLQWIARRRDELLLHPQDNGMLGRHLRAEEQEALLEMEIAFDAVRALWTGIDRMRSVQPELPKPRTAPRFAWLDALRANLTLESVMLRHALRLMVVGGADVVVMRAIHINHGYWLPMTSILLMQPYAAGTTRRSVQRVTGTVLGGIVAAALAAIVPSQVAMIPVIAGFICLALATYTIDYALFSFFLTPTFVLLSLPHLHDWRYAGIRMGTTLAGAAIALVAMRLLWPERAERELGRLLRRGAAADAAYLRATLALWAAPEATRRQAERQILAPARRACGLASADAEEAIDRVMQEPRFGRANEQTDTLRTESLTFATYLRRLTQSTTMLSAIGRDTPATHRRVERMAERLETLASASPATPVTEPEPGPALVDMQEEQLQRMERQTAVLERAAAAILPQAIVTP